LGIKSKDIVDIFAEKGVAVKTQAALEGRDFDILMETLTKQNQIKDIDSYIFGDTYIPSKLQAAKEAEMAAAAAEKAKAEAEAKAKAEAEAKSTKLRAEADAFQITEIGKAEGSKILEIGKATAEAYQQQVNAMGAENFAKFKITEEIGKNKIEIILVA
jgi:hypothetical protein